MYQGWSIERINQYNKMDYWFLSKMKKIVDIHQTIEAKAKLSDISKELLLDAKQAGFCDNQIGLLTKSTEMEVRKYRIGKKIIPYTKKIDTLGGEFPCVSNNLYLSYRSCLETDHRTVCIFRE